MENTLHCPKCGQPLTMNLDGGYLECVSGEMPLSGQLERRLRECYIDNLRTPADVAFTYNEKPHPIGGLWFCPGCAVQMSEFTPGDLRCSECHKSLVEFIYLLVERHPHKTQDGKWR